MTALAPRRPVAAVITDGPEAVTVARCAVRIAAEEGAPLLLLVPMLRSAFTADAVIAARVRREALREAEAVAARVRATVERAGISARVQVVWHRTCSPHRAEQGRAIALAHAAHKIGAAVIVTPAEVPVPTVWHGPEVVLVAEVGGATFSVHRPARSRRLAQL
ncbi:hypothetical protein ACH9EU_17245 [Kocuria sp. M1R5S2]|uniref:hypothetical protein n=1 Tax=Kocuria rhizosphaerae TaxID=3376285 RepID=UPI0037A26565